MYKIKDFLGFSWFGLFFDNYCGGFGIGLFGKMLDK